MTIFICRHCGAQNSPGRVKCRNCQSPLDFGLPGPGDLAATPPVQPAPPNQKIRTISAIKEIPSKPHHIWDLPHYSGVDIHLTAEETSFTYRWYTHMAWVPVLASLAGLGMGVWLMLITWSSYWPILGRLVLSILSLVLLYWGIGHLINISILKVGFLNLSVGHGPLPLLARNVVVPLLSLEGVVGNDKEYPGRVSAKLKSGRSQILVDIGDPKKAQYLAVGLDMLAKEKPASAATYVQRGLDQLGTANPRADRALAYFNRALLIDIRCAQAYYHRGILRMEHNKLAKAIEDFSAATRIDPQSHEYWHLLSVARRDAGDTENAIQDLSQAINLNPARGQYYLERCRLYLRHGIRSQARDDLEVFFRLSPTAVKSSEMESLRRELNFTK